MWTFVIPEGQNQSKGNQLRTTYPFFSLDTFFLPGTRIVLCSWVKNDLLTHYNYDHTQQKIDNEGTFEEKGFKPV